LKTFCTSVQALSCGFVTLLCLSILPEMVILTESFADRGNLLPNRCALLQGVQKTIESDDDWTILVRREHPLDDEWSVVATHGVSDDARVSASSILVFESVSGTDGLTVSHSLNDESSLESLEVHAAGSAGFVRRLRGDLGYRIHAFETASPRDAIRVVRMILAERVRELEQPNILLTSGHSRAD
jgi:hypothetical protein